MDQFENSFSVGNSTPEFIIPDSNDDSLYRGFIKANCFSSDFIDDKLLYSTKEGSIIFDDNLIKNNFNSNFVKFFPVDSNVFTATGNQGLSVFDSNRESVIYKYRNEELNDHCYSSNISFPLLAAFDQFNIKIFDLRMRYLAQSFIKSNIKQIGFSDTEIIVFDGYTIYIFDIRNEKISKTIEIGFVDGSLIFDHLNYYYVKNNKLFRNDNGKSTNFEEISAGKFSQNVLVCGIIGENIRIEHFGGFSEFEKADVKSIQNVYFGDRLSYIVSNEGVHGLYGGFNKIFELKK